MTSSSKEAEFISQWNGLLDFKIDESNLRRPNFQFFYGALESLLRSLNFNIEAAKNESAINQDAERLYYIRFCGFVQRLYQLSDESFNFFYLDLINPSKLMQCYRRIFHANNVQFFFFHEYSNRSEKEFPCFENVVQLREVLRNGEANSVRKGTRCFELL